VVAIDEDKPALRSEVPILVRVTDENDNDPVITHPSENNNTFYVSSHAPRHHTVIDVTATDIDTGVNAQLLYVIVNIGKANDREEVCFISILRLLVLFRYLFIFIS